MAVRSQQIWYWHSKRFAEYFKSAQRYISLCPFNCAHIGAVKATAVGEFFLGKAQAGTERAHVLCQRFPNLNSGFTKCALLFHSNSSVHGSRTNDRGNDAYASTEYK